MKVIQTITIHESGIIRQDKAFMLLVRARRYCTLVCFSSRTRGQTANSSNRSYQLRDQKKKRCSKPCIFTQKYIVGYLQSRFLTKSKKQLYIGHFTSKVNWKQIIPNSRNRLKCLKFGIFGNGNHFEKHLNP